MRKRQTADEVNHLRDRNHGDSKEIDKLNQTNENRAREINDLQQRIKGFEYEL